MRINDHIRILFEIVKNIGTIILLIKYLNMPRKNTLKEGMIYWLMRNVRFQVFAKLIKRSNGMLDMA